MSHDQYENPLITRYASKEMSRLWGAQKKFSTWRRLWVALAESQREMGLAITDEQIAELRTHVDDIDFEAALVECRKIHHRLALWVDSQEKPPAYRTDAFAQYLTALLYEATGDRDFRMMYIEHIETHMAMTAYWLEDYMYAHWVPNFGVYSIMLSYD